MLSVVAVTYACVESLTDSQSSSAKPTIQIEKPKTNDTVMVGENIVSYAASDGSGGQGLSFFEVYVNNKYVSRYEQGTDGSNPTIKLVVDSTLLGSRISYSIKAYNKGGRSDSSGTQKNIYVKDKLPKAPENLIVSRQSDYSVILLWNDVSNNEKGFELWRKDGGGAYRRIETMIANTISTNDNGISPFVDYFYKVRAFNDSGPSEFSNEVSTASLPGGQWNLRAEATGSSLITLKWNDFAVNELGFKIERKDYTGTWEVLAVIGADSTEYQDFNVSPSAAYTYRVAYFTRYSVSAYSNEVSISTYYTDVEGPKNLTASYFTLSNLAVIKWTNNANFNFETTIERKEGAYGKFVEIRTVPAGQDTIINARSSLKPPNTYYYRARHKIANRIYTQYSNTASAIVP